MSIEEIFEEQKAMEEYDVYLQGEAAMIATYSKWGYALCPLGFEACDEVFCIWKCEWWKRQVARATFPC